MSEKLLSELCSTCHTKKPKYKCPRCQTQTCSLKCYKRHQQRASCSGKRDPAAYLKKSQWATASGVDKDYNYLRGIERSIEDASQQAEGRGIGIDSSSSKTVTGSWQPGSALQRYLYENRINVQHAPKGMSRQKSNQTRTTKSGLVFWTIEWVERSSDGTSKSSLHHDCPASMTLRELYDALAVQRRNAEQRARQSNDEPAKKKRKTVASKDSPHPTLQSEQADHNSKLEEQPNEDAPAESVIHAIVNVPIVPAEPEPLATAEKNQKLDLSVGEASSTIQQSKESTSTTRFYLHRTNTSSSLRVLIPLDASKSLTEALQDQTVQEYPAVHVLSFAPENLPSGFVMETEYPGTTKVEATVPSPQGNPESERQARGRNEQSQPAAETKLDPNAILDMLRRDRIIS